MKFFVCFGFLCLLGSSFGQRSSYNHCSGAVFAPVEGSFSLQYLGDKKSNQIWVVFIAPKTGKIQIELNAANLSSQSAKGVLISSNEAFCGLDTKSVQITDSVLFDLNNKKSITLNLQKNQYATLCLTSNTNAKDNVVFSCVFEALYTQEEAHELNLVYDKALPTYTLLIRDEQLLTPVAGRIYLQGSAEINGSYYASKLHMNLKQNIKKATIKVDAPGYFPVEFNERSIPYNSHKIDTILLHKFAPGELSKLEQVYFDAGLPQIMEESYAQLNRLRDLLILNPLLSIEIHGHVNLDENSTKKAQKLATQRARMVKSYLVKNGISAERLYPIGFGFSKPVFQNPQDEAQKEANRRVEILIRQN